MIEDKMFDESMFKLGPICGKNHEYENTGMSLRYKSVNKCNECCKISSKNWQNKEEQKNYYNKRKKYLIDYYNKNKEKILMKDKIYREKPEIKEHKREQKREHNKKVEIKKLNNDTKTKRRHNNIKIRLLESISSQINQSLKGNKNNKHCEEIVGWKIQELKEHLEKFFSDSSRNCYTNEKMSWSNYGRGKDKWQIDHIKPASWFNYNSYKDEEFKQCWKLSNLQPMWHIYNASKNCWYEGEYKND